MRGAAAAAACFFCACARAKAPEASLAPRQTLEDFSMSQSELGKPEWKLEARRAILKEESQEVSLLAPRLEFYEKAKAASKVSALAGTADLTTHDVLLSSDVVVTSLEERSVLKTSSLRYSEARRKFYTDAEVELKRPAGTLHGRGIEADPGLTEVRIFKQTSVVAPPKS